MAAILQHPFWRYGAIVVCALGATATLALSAYVNPLSAPWAIGIYLCTFLLFRLVKQGFQTPLLKSYLLYLITMHSYFSIVYLMYAAVPGPYLVETQEYIDRWASLLRQMPTLVAAAHLSFTLRFAKLDSKFWRALQIVSWAAGGMMFCLSFSPNYILYYKWVAGVVWVPENAGYYAWLFYDVSATLTASFIAGVYALFTTRDSRHRLQMLYFVIGDIPLWLTCWSHFLLSMGINIIPLGGIMVLWHIAVMAYAVMFKRVFDFSIVIRRGLAYAFASALLGCLYALSIWIMTAELGVELFSSGVAPLVVFLVVAGLLFAPLLDAMQRVVDRLFFREAIDRQVLLSSFARDMASTIDLETVIRTTCAVMKESLHPRAVRMYLLNEQGRPFLRATLVEEFDIRAATPGDVIRDDVFDALRPGESVQRVRLPLKRPETRPLLIADGDEHLLVPVLHRDSLLGIILLEPPRSREQYEPEDEQFAGTLAAQATVALLHARSYAAMARLQELTQRTLEGVPFGVLAAMQNGNVSICNQAFRRILSLAEANTSLNQIWQAQPQLAEIVKPAIARNEPFDNVEVRFNGGALQCLASLKILSGDGALHGPGPLYLLLIHDVTEYKQMELLARRREGLAQVGEMIASINHEISNILQPVKHQVQRLQEAHLEKPSFRRAMEVIPERLSALERLLANLRDLARPVEVRMRIIDLPDLLESLARELRETEIGRNASIEYECAPDAADVHADGHWLRQVLYNLGKNALEACARVERPEIIFRSKSEAAWIVLEVRDNGCGMPPDQISRLFEPFYTTRSSAGGTGLGLSLSKKLIMLHGGRIEVASEPGKGTTFTIVLPAARRGATVPSAV
ncbi:MAG TPA: ATP-binding protein [Planctomycetota bacterium]|nr:ATP-binding protein [Planctomycetota bacterium]